jgi:glycosyltransferase involved in cell wall biosynthesis
MFEEKNSLFHSAVSWVFFAMKANASCIRRTVGERLSEKDSVLLVEGFISGLRQPTYYRLGERFNTKKAGLTSYSYFHTPERIPFVRPLLKSLNRRRLISEIIELLGHPPTVVCYDSPTQFHLVGRFQEKVSVYVAVDDRTVTLTGHPIKGEIEAEKKLLSKVDLVVCVSEPLADAIHYRISNQRKVPVHVFPNGYNARVFDPNRVWAEPTELKPLPRPRVLVAGHISDRIDWEGIREASRMRPEWTWVFVGPPDPGIQESIFHGLGSQGSWHPPIPLEEVPAWIQNCDACAVPYRLNCFTLASSPLKAIEYLAMGSPVLSTRIPALQPYGDVINWVDESCGKSYALELDKALEEKKNSGRMKARRMTVSNDSWTKKAETFKELVLNVRSSQSS